MTPLGTLAPMMLRLPLGVSGRSPMLPAPGGRWSAVVVVRGPEAERAFRERSPAPAAPARAVSCEVAALAAKEALAAIDLVLLLLLVGGLDGTAEARTHSAGGVVIRVSPELLLKPPQLPH